MGVFTGIEDAKVGAGGVYFLEGLYKVEIKKVLTLLSRKKEQLFIVEAAILESDNPNRKKGTGASWVVNLKQDAALGNIKGFLRAANGEDPHDEDVVVTEEEVEFACSEENPLAGVVMGLECVATKTRAGGDFTLHKWQRAD